MNKTLFTGSGVALITPMNIDGSVNYDKINEIVDFQIDNGTDCIIPVGTTGESATLSTDEHRSVMEYIVRYVNKRVPVIVGAGSNETAVSVKFVKYAYDCGADGVLLVTPYYNKTTQNGLVKHFSEIAKSADIPIVLYNVPSRTGLNIMPETFVELAKIDTVVAVKEASGDISQVAKIINACGDKLDIYSGNDDQIVPILSLGGKGVISVLANICPKETHMICEEYFKGNVKESCRLQIEYLDLINALFCEVNPIPIKEAMNIIGKEVGECRLPLVRPEECHQELLKKVLKNHGLIK